MTEFHVEVVRIGQIEKHPNAHSLSMTKVHGGYPVLFRTENYKEGDLAVYVPVDSVVPPTEEWAWLSPEGNIVPREKDRRVRAKKLRGVFSMGLLCPAPEGAEEGQDVAELLGITKYEEPEHHVPGAPGVPGYYGISAPDGREAPSPHLEVPLSKYDIEGFRKYNGIFEVGEEVVLTEKIHGQNARFVVTKDGEFHVGSRSRWVKTDPTTNSFAATAAKYKLAEKLAKYPEFVLFGETYGNNSDMPYGVRRQTEGDGFIAFDVYDSRDGRWLSHAEFRAFCGELDIPMVPVLAHLHWEAGSYEALLSLAEGDTTLGTDVHVREGYVIKPCRERWDHRIGRVILKLHGEGFLTRK